jgi:hypothetical protein
MSEQKDETQKTANINLESVDISVYFIPPITTSFMKWGESILVIVFLGIMFSIISLLYINVNMNEYQSRIDVMSNGSLYGIDPQQKFEQYIKNTQAEALATAMGTIDKSTDTLNRAINRMDDKSTRLTRQLANDTTTTANSTDSLGTAIQENTGKLGGIVEKLGGALVLNSYMSNGAIKTTQVAPGSSAQTLFSAAPGFAAQTLFSAAPGFADQTLFSAAPGTSNPGSSNPGTNNPGTNNPGSQLGMFSNFALSGTPSGPSVSNVPSGSNGPSGGILLGSTPSGTPGN